MLPLKKQNTVEKSEQKKANSIQQFLRVGKELSSTNKEINLPQ